MMHTKVEKLHIKHDELQGYCEDVKNDSYGTVQSIREHEDVKNYF